MLNNYMILLIIFIFLAFIIDIAFIVSAIEDNRALNGFNIDLKHAYYKNTRGMESFTYSKESTGTKYKENKNNYRTKEKKTYIGSNGYVYFLDSNKPVHRWVVERSLGRKLYYEEVIHHIDGNKLNNRINNLKLFPNQEEHNKYHREHLKNYGSWYEEVPEYANYKKFPEYAR